MGSYVVHNAPQGGPAPACNFPGGNFADGNAICDWDYRKKVTIDNTKVSADLTDYLLMVDLADMGSNFHSNAKSDGSDIRVTKSDGTTELAYYISQIDTTANTGIMWVRYNGTLSSTVDTDIYIYYANASASAYAAGATYGRNNTFQDYEAFWDFEQDPSDSAPQLTDLTGNGNDGTSQGGMTSGDEVAGKVGNAWDFDGGSDYVDVGTLPSIGTALSSTNTVIDLWLNTTTAVPDELLGTLNDGLTSGLDLRLNANNGFAFQLNRAVFFIRDESGNRVNVTFDITPLRDGNWHKLTIKFNAETDIITNTVEILIDGVKQTETNHELGLIGTTFFQYPLYLAAINVRGSSTNYFDGLFSYFIFRKTPTPLSNDYFATEYANQNSPSTFYTVGTQETS